MKFQLEINEEIFFCFFSFYLGFKYTDKQSSKFARTIRFRKTEVDGNGPGEVFNEFQFLLAKYRHIII